MKPATLLFFALLAYAHRVSELYEPLEQPLCAFREGELPALGYALFAALALVGVTYDFTLRRAGQSRNGPNAAGTALLFALVAATPSSWPIHRAGAAVLIGSIFLHYALILMDQKRIWLQFHLAAPILFAIAASFRYGLWQKCMICYLISAGLVHHHFIKARVRTGRAAHPLDAAAAISASRRRITFGQTAPERQLPSQPRS